jgi:hypothetical protein
VARDEIVAAPQFLLISSKVSRVLVGVPCVARSSARSFLATLWPWYALLGGALVATSVALGAFVLGTLETPYLAETDNRNYRPFELLGLTGSLAMGVALFVALRRARARLERILPTLLAIGVGFAFLGYFTEHSFRSHDYLCYEDAAQKIVSKRAPYGWCYLYPPLLAQTLGAVFQQLGRLSSWWPPGVLEARRWDAVFLFYQTMQLAALVAAIPLSLRVLSKFRACPSRAALFVSVLFLLNAPLLRTIDYNQVNLFLLTLMLVAIAFADENPYLAGTAIGLSAHLKLYPIAMLGPFLLHKKWRVAVGALTALVVVLAWETQLFVNWDSWRAYRLFVESFPKGTALRDNGLHAIAFNTLRLLKPLGVPDPARMAQRVYVWGAALVTALVLFRVWQRWRLEDPKRLWGDLADAHAWMLLVSPLVWEHHYLLAIPTMLIAFAAYGEANGAPKGLLVIAAILLFAIPTFDFYPFSSHRLAGLMLLLWITRPRPLASAAGSDTPSWSSSAHR